MKDFHASSIVNGGEKHLSVNSSLHFLLFEFHQMETQDR